MKQQLNPSEGGVGKPAGKARRRVMPRHGEEEQRSQTVSPPRQRTGSGFTQSVSVIEAQNISQHEASRGIRSGQLLFQGSRTLHEPDHVLNVAIDFGPRTHKTIQIHFFENSPTLLVAGHLDQGLLQADKVLFRE